MSKTSFAFLLILISGCSVSTPGLEFGSTPGKQVSVAVYPSSLTVGPNTQSVGIYGSETTTTSSGASFDVYVANQSSLFTWRLDEGASAGSLAPTAGSDTYFTYTSPSQPGVYHLTLTDKTDPTQSARMTITVTGH